MAEENKEELEETTEEEGFDPQSQSETNDNESNESDKRKSAAEHIIARKQKQIERNKKQIEEMGGESEEEPQGLTADEVRNIIGEETQSQFQKSQTDEQELQEVFSKYPESKELESDIRAEMSKPQYGEVALKNIFFMVAGQKGVSVGSKEGEEQAENEAAASEAGGNSIRPNPDDTGIPYKQDMTDEEVSQLADKVKTGQLDN